MRTLVALAVMGLWTALPQQAYATYPRYSSSSHYQPRYTGPWASSVPAGVNGQVIPVSDTYEVTAARNAFFDAYQKQLIAVGAIGGYNPLYQQTAYGGVHTPGQTIYNPGQTLYSPGQTIYNPGQSIYTNGQTLYSPGQTNYNPGQSIYSNGQTIYNPGQTIYDPIQSVYTSGQNIYNPSQAIYSPGQAYSTTPFYAQTNPSTVVVANGHVQDTPEVAAAKAQFFALYNQQAAAAAAAPDVYNH